MKQKIKVNCQNLQMVFKMFDNDKDGLLSYNEFKNLAYNTGVCQNESSVQILYYRFDKCGKNFINYEDFECTMMS